MNLILKIFDKAIEITTIKFLDLVTGESHTHLIQQSNDSNKSRKSNDYIWEF